MRIGDRVLIKNGWSLAEKDWDVIGQKGVIFAFLGQGTEETLWEVTLDSGRVVNAGSDSLEGCS